MKYLFTKGVSRMSIDEIIKSAAKDLSVNRCACEAIRSDSCTLPNREVIIQVLEDLQKAIFPGYFDGETLTDASAEYYEGYLLTEIYRKLKPQIEIALRIPTSNLNFDEADYGIGIRSVIATTEKYEGMYDFSSANGTFVSKICLNF
jgi:hypothetical protein